MARALVSTAVGTVGFFLFFVLSQSNPSTLSSPLLLPPPYHGVPSAVILPLYPSPKNSSRTSSNTPRHLLRSDSHSSHTNARMRLYDDLVLNGYYTTRLWIGTPPQQFALIVDTGSTVTYVPCATCELCGSHQDPKFQPDLSSTYQPVKCTSDCNCDADREQCIYERQYAEMSSSSGVLGEDVISFGNQSALVPQRAVFGCENEETGDLYSQHADGIMGLGRGDLSVVDQLVEKGVISDSFSLCYGGMDIGGGAMVLGGISAPSDMVFSYSDPVRSPYYNVDLKEIHVAGKQLHLNPSVFDGKYGTVLDSGTTYAYLPEAAFLAFKEAIFKDLSSLKQVQGPDPNYNDICFSSASSDVSELSKTFPTVDMVFGHQQNLSLSPENYLFQHSKIQGAYCLGIFQNEKDPTTLLGGIIVRNTLVTYDRKHSKIGFWKTNCSELWERLRIPGAPSPSPSSREKGNSTVSPTTSAPGGSSHYDLPEETQIGKITLDVSLSTNYSYLKPQINKLIEVIAKELDVNASQVNLLNFTSEGTSSLVRLTVTPSGSSTYISHESATNIISLLAKHRVRLPDTFGNYQLVQWKFEPSVKRTWRQRNHMTVVVAVIVIIVVGLSVYGVWGMWRRRQQTVNTYKPIGAAVPEQELQPL
ncbi:RING/U-box superfamily protein with ARM repeat domain isoform 1 [Hibiscus syriacus]|uniref:RING/U-box superfamily protein with ARM repeat domain isoform 1 n=1 Tax=Hibiscus syriacus TaxID=106335 RepID=A0A6A2Y7Z1_HIBSY|nr:aspartic proteinase 39-like [Hibiscus syriacus]KAE8665764.1 RING/U-box superfamily protein with ARM repeat domain isoform 1 [Hibiscus syriacus]